MKRSTVAQMKYFVTQHEALNGWKAGHTLQQHADDADVKRKQQRKREKAARKVNRK